jgi:hypothetical protein
MFAFELQSIRELLLRARTLGVFTQMGLLSLSSSSSSSSSSSNGLKYYSILLTVPLLQWEFAVRLYELGLTEVDC